MGFNKYILIFLETPCNCFSAAFRLNYPFRIVFVVNMTYNNYTDLDNFDF